jgi:hypothetical protein
MTQRTQCSFTDDFKREAVRLTQTSGRTISQVPKSTQNYAPSCFHGSDWVIGSRIKNPTTY